MTTADIHTAAITGNVEAVRRFLAQDPANAVAVSEPYGGNALVYLCLSKYLRFDKDRSDDFLLAATALLNAGASLKNIPFPTSYPEADDILTNYC